MENTTYEFGGFHAEPIDRFVRADRFSWTGQHGTHEGTANVLEGYRADLSSEMPGVPSAEFHRADVAHHV